MLKFCSYDSENHCIVDHNEYKDELWIKSINSIDDIDKIVEITGISKVILKNSLDPEEQSRLTIRNEYVLAVINAPILKENDAFDTIPVVIIITDKHFVTMCRTENDVTAIYKFFNYKLYDINIEEKEHFLLHLLYSTSKSFVENINIIVKKLNVLEQELFNATKNEDVIKVMNLQKSMTLFTMALYGNANVIEKLKKIRDGHFQNNLFYADKMDTELLEDVNIEHKQAFEMVNTYSKILTDMMQSVGSMISNNQNKFMKFLSNITLLLTIPMLFSSFWGMNVKIPWEGTLTGFIFICGTSLLVTGTIFGILWKKDLLR